MEWAKGKVSGAVGSATTDNGKDGNEEEIEPQEQKPREKKPQKKPSQDSGSQGGVYGYATRAYRGITGASEEAYDQAGDYAGDTYDQAGDFAGDTYNQATDVAGDMYEGAGENLQDLTGSFKPDSSLIWQGYGIYGILAGASMTFWWASISAADYLESVYPGYHIIRCFVFAYFGGWLISYLIVSIFWRDATSWLKINVGLSLSIYALFKLALLAGLLISNEGTTTTFWMLLVEVVIAGVADSITRGCVVGIASELPEGFMRASVCGAVAAGVFAFIVRVITKAALSPATNGLAIGAVIHFCICALFVVSAMALFSYIHRMPSMSYYESLNLGSADTLRLLIQNEDKVPLEVASGAAIATVATGRSSPPAPLKWVKMLDKIYLLLIATAVTGIISFSVFPSYLTEEVHASSLGTWYPVLLVGTYVIFDLLGVVTSVKISRPKQSTVFALALARLVLLVAFILALIYGPGHTTSMVAIFFLTAIVAYTNGYLVAIMSYLIPKSTTLIQAETASILSGLVLYISGLIGVGLSFSFAEI